MADQNTPLQTRSNMGYPIETSLAEMFAASGIVAALGLASAAQGVKADSAVQTLKAAVVAGAAAGDVTVTGIVTTDKLALVLHLVGAGTAITDVADLTSEFTISAADTINNAAGTASTGDKLLILYTKV